MGSGRHPAAAVLGRGWVALGLPPPEPGFQWYIRPGPAPSERDDRRVVDVAYGVFY
jgi:hypothetical protein